MFDQIKLPVCPVCDARCTTVEAALVDKGAIEAQTLTFACGAKYCTAQGEAVLVKQCSKATEVLEELRAELAKLRDECLLRLKAAQDEQGKGYGTSV